MQRDNKGRFVKGNNHTKEEIEHLSKLLKEKCNKKHLKKIGFKKGIDPRRSNDGKKFEKGHKINLGKRRIITKKLRKALTKNSPFKKGRFIGNKNPNWKGGKKRIREIIAYMPEYEQWRSDVFKRDNWTCCDCHKIGGILNVHHIKSAKKIIEEFNIKTLNDARICKFLWNISNGITLCFECHKRIKENR